VWANISIAARSKIILLLGIEVEGLQLVGTAREYNTPELPGQGQWPGRDKYSSLGRCFVKK
jgi:hypothetical protein